MAEHPRGSHSAPFTVHYSPAGFSSSASPDEGKAELWLPIWRQRASYRELQQLFREARSTVGRREARTGLDFTRAVRTLGVSRGVDAFVRYAFLRRRGDSQLALPAGRLPVRFDRRVRLLDDLDPMLERLDQFMRGLPSVPASLTSLRRQVEVASYACAFGPTPEHFGALVCALGHVEQALAVRSASGATVPSRPLLGLRPAWVQACDDGSAEVRVAAALASVRGDRQRRVGPLRCNLTPVEPTKPWQWSAGHGQRRWIGANLMERLGGALVQRLHDADRLNVVETPLAGRVALSAHDLVSFLYGNTDDGQIESLLWGFGLVEWHREADRRALARIAHAWTTPLGRLPVPRCYGLLKLLHWLEQKPAARKKRRGERQAPAMSWVGALCLSTSELLDAGWSSPPAMHEVDFVLPPGALRGKVRRRLPSFGSRFREARFALHSSVLPRLVDAVAVAERVRRKLMGIHRRRMGGDPALVSRKLSGKGLAGEPAEGHRHAYFLCIDEDGDGRIDHLLVRAADPFDEQELAALDGLRSVWQRGGRPDVQLVLEALTAEAGNVEARRWVSATPFVTRRHHRKGRGSYTTWLDSEIRRACAQHGLPQPVALDVLDHVSTGGSTIRWLEFMRSRADEAPLPGCGRLLTFAEAVRGPFAIGALAHFGLGLFVPARPEAP